MSDIAAAGPRRARLTERPRFTAHAGRTRATADKGYQIRNNVSGGRAIVDIHGEIGPWGIDAASFIAELRGIQADEIELNLSSPGGDVFDGIDIYQALLDFPGPVEVRISSLAGSIASVIAQAGDKVVIGSAAKMMVHSASGGAWGKAEELRYVADILDGATETIAQVYATRSNTGTVRSWLAAMNAGVDGTWYTAAEAVEAGLADEINDGGTRPTRDPEDTWRASVAYQMAARTHALMSATDVGDGSEAATDDPSPTPPDDANEVDVEGESVTGEGVDGPAEPGPGLVDALAAVDLSGLGEAVHAALTDNGFDSIDWDPNAIAAAIEEAANDAPAHLAPPPSDPPPNETEIHRQVATAIQEGLQSL